MAVWEMTSVQEDFDWDEEVKHTLHYEDGPFRLPKVACPHCPYETGFGEQRNVAVPKEFELALTDPPALSPSDWKTFRQEASRQLGLKVQDLTPGMLIGPPHMEGSGIPPVDVIPEVGGHTCLIKDHVADYVRRGNLSGVRLERVVLPNSPEFRREKMWELSTSGEASIERNHYHKRARYRCRVCGARVELQSVSQRDPRTVELVRVPTNFWDGSDTFILHNSLPSLYLNKRAADYLRAGGFSNLKVEWVVNVDLESLPRSPAGTLDYA